MTVYLRFGYKFSWTVEEDDSEIVQFVMYKINFYAALLKE